MEPKIEGFERCGLVVQEIDFKSAEQSCKLFLQDRFSILIIVSGSILVKINNTESTLQKGSLVIVPLRATGRILKFDAVTKILSVSYNTDFVSRNAIRNPHPGYFDFYISDIPTILKTNISERTQVTERLKLLYKYSKSVASGSLFGHELLRYGFNLFVYEIADILHNHGYNVNGYYGRKENLTMNFFSILEKHFRSQHSVQFYADSLFITRSHLGKTIKAVTGRSAKQSIEDAIVIEAKSLLLKSMTLVAISEELNFSNPAFFSNFFKKHTGYTPSEYRSTG